LEFFCFFVLQPKEKKHRKMGANLVKELGLSEESEGVTLVEVAALWSQYSTVEGGIPRKHWQKFLKDWCSAFNEDSNEQRTQAKAVLEHMGIFLEKQVAVSTSSQLSSSPSSLSKAAAAHQHHRGANLVTMNAFKKWIQAFFEGREARKRAASAASSGASLLEQQRLAFGSSFPARQFISHDDGTDGLAPHHHSNGEGGRSQRSHSFDMSASEGAEPQQFDVSDDSEAIGRCSSSDSDNDGDDSDDGGGGNPSAKGRVLASAIEADRRISGSGEQPDRSEVRSAWASAKDVQAPPVLTFGGGDASGAVGLTFGNGTGGGDASESSSLSAAAASGGATSPRSTSSSASGRRRARRGLSFALEPKPRLVRRALKRPARLNVWDECEYSGSEQLLKRGDVASGGKSPFNVDSASLNQLFWLLVAPVAARYAIEQQEFVEMFFFMMPSFASDALCAQKLRELYSAKGLLCVGADDDTSLDQIRQVNRVRGATLRVLRHWLVAHRRDCTPPNAATKLSLARSLADDAARSSAQLRHGAEQLRNAADMVEMAVAAAGNHENKSKNEAARSPLDVILLAPSNRSRQPGRGGPGGFGHLHHHGGGGPMFGGDSAGGLGAESIDWAAVSLFDADISVVAEQLSLRAHVAFAKIKQSEFFAWLHGRHEDAANLAFFNSRFTVLSSKMVSTIVSTRKLEERVGLLSRAIELGNALLELNDIIDGFAVVCSLNSPPVRRLAQTFDGISKARRQQFDAMLHIFALSERPREFARWQDQLSSPVVPYMGCYRKLFDHYRRHRLQQSKMAGNDASSSSPSSSGTADWSFIPLGSGSGSGEKKVAAAITAADEPLPLSAAMPQRFVSRDVIITRSRPEPSSTAPSPSSSSSSIEASRRSSKLSLLKDASLPPSSSLSSLSLPARLIPIHEYRRAHYILAAAASFRDFPYSFERDPNFSKLLHRLPKISTKEQIARSRTLENQK
jgi:RasGEF domain